jgi:hypothetical protein
MKTNKRKARQEPDQIEEIKKLLPAVLNKLFPVPIEKLKWCKGIMYDQHDVDLGEEAKYRDIFLFPQTHPLNEQDLIDHFLQKILPEHIDRDNVQHWNPEAFADKDNVLGWRGELFIELKDRDTNHVKSFCLQSCGEDDMYEIDNELLPVLDSYSVDYVIHRLKDQLT